MAKFKRNHDRQKHSLFPKGVKLLFFLFLLGVLSAVYYFQQSGSGPERSAVEDDYFSGDSKPAGSPGLLTVQDEFLPTSNLGTIVKKEHYALSYVEKFEQAEWVAYELTKKSIQAPNIKRTGDFRRDRDVRTGSADREDYRGSGYDRGHLTPAGDMAFSRESMSSTFLMSNISPQVRAFNGGVWRELEENVRNWAYESDKIYVVSGPVLTEPAMDYIGDNKVAVPSRYFKVILDNQKPDIKAIAFLMPNEVTQKHLKEFVVSIDEVEKVTGLDFFHELLSPEQEIALEQSVDVRPWKFDEGKYKARKKNWNNR